MFYGFIAFRGNVLDGIHNFIDIYCHFVRLFIFLLNLIFIDNFKGIQIRDVYICFLMHTYLIFFLHIVLLIFFLLHIDSFIFSGH